MAKEPERPKMFRDIFYRLDKLSAPTYRIILAEDAAPLSAEAGYKDLLEFEQDIAQVVGLILLFVESAGSLAELGAFAALPTVAPSLLAVVDEYFYNQQSFVKNGPIRYLENKHGDDWIHSLERTLLNIGENGETEAINEEEFMRSLKPVIENRLASSSASRSFNRDSAGHRILLIVGLCQLFGALTLSELRSHFRILGVSSDRLHSLIWCGELLGWILKVRKGNHIFFAGVPVTSALDFSFDASQTQRDKIRIRSDIREHWKQADPPRLRAIAEANSVKTEGK